MQSELKPCPFCSEQCATLVIDQGDKWAHYEPSCLEVRTGYDLSDDAAWRAEAITAWNARASDAEITRLTEALRDADEREKQFVDALIWCSGSAEFNEGGQARNGWLKLCRPLIEAALAGAKP